MEQDTFLQEQQARLTDLLRPYQRELTRRQRIADFVTSCLRSAGRDDFFTLYELLHSRTCSEVEAEAGWEEAQEVLAHLRDDATHKVERSQLTFLENFARLAQEAGLPLENDFPRLRLLKGIELEVEFTHKRTLINGRPFKTVDPQRLIRTVLALKRRLARPLRYPHGAARRSVSLGCEPGASVTSADCPPPDITVTRSAHDAQGAGR